MAQGLRFGEVEVSKTALAAGIEPRPVVVRSGAVPAEERDGVSTRIMIDRRSRGCRHLEQRLLAFAPGAYRTTFNQHAEDVMFVTAGRGRVLIGDQVFPIRQGMGILAPPGINYALHNTGTSELSLISVLAPQRGFEAATPAADIPKNTLGYTVHADSQPDEEASAVRRFKLLIDPRFGARYVTQFFGIVAKSKAPAHRHHYEEVITILRGEGLLHLDHGTFPFQTGDSIYLPAQARHCLENPDEEPLHLLGVFCPSGSPAAANLDD